MSTTDECAYIYKEAEELCRNAFYAGADYADASAQYSVNAVAYDWEHWLERNKHLFMPKPKVEDVLREFAERWNDPAHYAKGELVESYAARLRLEDAE